MEAESFFSRWEKRNAEAALEKRAPPVSSETVRPQPPEPVLAPPTLEDVALLNTDSDFTRFVAPGVDETIRRSAMKKLFADPRFNVMDGLDVYIEDYHTFTPIPAAMLAALTHGKALLDPLAHLESSLTRLLDVTPDTTGADESARTTTSEDKPEEYDPLAKEQSRDDDPVQGM